MEKDFLKLQEAHKGQQALLQKLQMSEMCYNKYVYNFVSSCRIWKRSAGNLLT